MTEHKSPAPVYGLPYQLRPYRCICCGGARMLETDNTDESIAYCDFCGWVGESYPVAAMCNGRAYRTFVYAGPEPLPHQGDLQRKMQDILTKKVPPSWAATIRQAITEKQRDAVPPPSACSSAD